MLALRSTFDEEDRFRLDLVEQARTICNNALGGRREETRNEISRDLEIGRSRGRDRSARRERQKTCEPHEGYLGSRSGRVGVECRFRGPRDVGE